MKKRNTEESLLSSYPITVVTIFSDRAEVKRLIRVKLRKGLNEIILKRCANKTVGESVRVSGGKGIATILEVSTESQSYTNIVIKPKRIEEVNIEIQDTQSVLNLVLKERAWFEDYSKLITTSVHCMDFEEAVEFNTKFYPNNIKEFDQRIAKLQNQIETLKDEEVRLKSEHKKALIGAAVSNLLDINILLHSENGGAVELEISYIIKDAYWSPLYDARADTKTSKLGLTYYGNIINNTEEDWNDVNLLLSTATPSLNGSPPELFTLRVTARSTVHVPHVKASFKPTMQSFQPPPPSRNVFSADSPRKPLSSLAPPTESSKPVEVMTTQVQSSGTSTSFLIPRKASIASDSKPHKVTIAQLDLSAKYTYTAVPAKSTYAYLRGACENNSDYPILPGPVSVFLENNFIANSTIKHCNPREEFGVHLGTDEGVVIEPKPESREHATLGIMKKSKSVTVQQITVIKNTKPYEIKLSVFQNHPQSVNDKLKVKLIEPELNSPDFIINDFNNLVCTYSIPSGKDIRCIHKYQMEYPIDNELVQT